MESGLVNVKKRKRSSLSLKRKYEIVNKLDDGACTSDVIKDYGIGKSTTYEIKQKKNQNSYEWFKLKRSEGLAISGPMFVAKAKDLHIIKANESILLNLIQYIFLLIYGYFRFKLKVLQYVVY